MLTFLKVRSSLLRPELETFPMLESQNPSDCGKSITKPKLTVAKPEESRRSVSSRLAIVMHVVFMVWGLAVLIAHVQAVTHTKLAGCALKCVRRGLPQNLLAR